MMPKREAVTALNVTLEAFLAAKPLEHTPFDPRRMPRFWEEYAALLPPLPPVVQLVGTNGKGTTGRFLASMLHGAGLSVGHFTSPHLLSVRERFWLNGATVEETQLEEAHQELWEVLGEKLQPLSYFEYLVLLAIMLFRGCDRIVMEAGMGGEFDATSVFACDLMIVTPIGPDHQETLGKSVAEIARTKLRAMRSDLLLARQRYEIVCEMATQMATQRGYRLFESRFAPAQVAQSVQKYTRQRALPSFLAENLATALYAANLLGTEVNVDDAELLEGRMMVLSPRVTVDVGHNLPAAQELVTHFKEKKVKLVYNSFADKDYQAILTTLHPIVDEVLILSLDGPRMLAQSELEFFLETNGFLWHLFEGIEVEGEYLVFGSFRVVERFMRDFWFRRGDDT